jgi:hypothetical protein
MGESEFSPEVSTIINLFAPTNFTALPSYPWTSMTLTWEDNSNYEEGYVVERRGIGEGYSYVATLGENATQFEDGDVRIYEDYCYRVWAFSGDTAFSESVEVYVTNAPYFRLVPEGYIAPYARRMLRSGYREIAFLSKEYDGRGKVLYFNRIRSDGSIVDRRELRRSSMLKMEVGFREVTLDYGYVSEFGLGVFPVVWVYEGEMGRRRMHYMWLDNEGGMSDVNELFGDMDVKYPLVHLEDTVVHMVFVGWESLYYTEFPFYYPEEAGGNMEYIMEVDTGFPVVSAVMEDGVHIICRDKGMNVVHIVLVDGGIGVDTLIEGSSDDWMQLVEGDVGEYYLGLYGGGVMRVYRYEGGFSDMGSVVIGEGGSFTLVYDGEKLHLVYGDGNLLKDVYYVGAWTEPRVIGMSGEEYSYISGVGYREDMREIPMGVGGGSEEVMERERLALLYVEGEEGGYYREVDGGVVDYPWSGVMGIGEGGVLRVKGIGVSGTVSRGKVVFDFVLEVRTDVEMEVYDVLGRRVYGVRERMDAGSHRIVWEGEGMNGRDLRSGVYFYRVRVGDEERKGKLVLIR